MTMKQRGLFPISIYCIDTSALINLTRLYPRNLFPAIWEKLEDLVRRGELISPVEVYKEIEARDDPIFQWCKQNKRMFKDIDDCQTQKIAQIETKYETVYWKTQIDKDAPWADPWLIALSICEDAIIITDEGNRPDHIPYIANHFQKQCLKLLKLFEEIGVKYER